MRFLAKMVIGVVLGGCVQGSVQNADPATQALDLINKERTKAGCQPLVMQPQLMAAATGFAHDMAEQNFMAHEGRDGSTLSSRVHATGYRGGFLGENIAGGQTSAWQVVDSWMHSKGHRANILTCAFNVTGIAMVRQANDQAIGGNPAPYFTYWVHDFGRE
jgi:uncharacterized protein YkwD